MLTNFVGAGSYVSLFTNGFAFVQVYAADGSGSWTITGQHQDVFIWGSVGVEFTV